MCENFQFKVDYFDKDGEIKVDLFSDEAQKVVECFIGQNSKYDYREKRGRRQLIKKISYNQIRKFYEEVLNLKEQIENGREFRKILPYFKMLKAKANVAYERDVINTNFKTFIEKNVDYVDNDEKKFEIFCTFFEAIIAYAKGNRNIKD